LGKKCKGKGHERIPHKGEGKGEGGYETPEIKKTNNDRINCEGPKKNLTLTY